MPHRFHLPDIGEGLEEAEVVEWLVAPGDVVVRDQPLVEVLTDKASSELPSPVAGTILRLGASEGERIRVGALLIEIDDGSVDGAAGALDPEMPPVDEGVATADPPTPTSRPRVAPRPRRPPDGWPSSPAWTWPRSRGPDRVVGSPQTTSGRPQPRTAPLPLQA